jgi:hypothetical protein
MVAGARLGETYRKLSGCAAFLLVTAGRPGSDISPWTAVSKQTCLAPAACREAAATSGPSWLDGALVPIQTAASCSKMPTWETGISSSLHAMAVGALPVPWAWPQSIESACGMLCNNGCRRPWNHPPEPALCGSTTPRTNTL